MNDQVRTSTRKGADSSFLHGWKSGLKAIFERSHDLILVLDDQIRPVTGNPAFMETFGPLMDEMNPLAHFHPDDLGQALATVQALIGNGKEIRGLEYRFRMPDGEYRHFDTDGYPVQMGDERFIILVNRDITERKIAEEKLSASEDRYRRLTENARDLIWRADLDGTVRYVNESVRDVLGLTPEEAIGKTIDQYMAPESIRQVRKWLKDSISGSTPREGFRGDVEYIHGDGRRLPCEFNVSLVRNDDGRIVALEGISRDISERRQSEQALVESEERYRSIFETAANLITSVDTEGIIVDCNSRIRGLLGYEPEEIVGQSMAKIIHPDWMDKAQESLGLILEKGKLLDREYKMVHKDGSTVDVSINSSGLKGGNGHYYRTICIITDISARKQAEMDRLQLEAQLRQRQKLESIGTLAAGVAHEINNPLNIISNYAELILDDAPAGGPISLNAVEIVDTSDRIADIVRSLLAFSRQEGDRHSLARMKDIVDGTLKLMGSTLERENIRFVVDVPDDLPRVPCRTQQIQQVLMNLLSNARDALAGQPEEGNGERIIDVTAREIIRNGSRWLRLTIADSGTGIPADVQSRIFDPFFTTKPRDQGTGLGLSVSHGIIVEHGGELTVESVEGQYTRFHLDLPVADEPA